MPMHCSANVGVDGDAAVFFGLSGTGKTTLSADPNRTLLGDDEHGWSQNGVFNFEGGCYAKTIRLSGGRAGDLGASNRFGTVLENVVLRPGTREPDFDDNKLAENARSAYPLHYIASASPTSRAGNPKNIVMLTADAFGVLPPIAKLTPSQAMHFLSGYTAKVAGTEKGMGNEPSATFSTCFGAPFMPRHPSVYGNLLRKLIGEHNVDCWLVSTGWTGGKFGTGHRMPIRATRALLDAALSGSSSTSRFASTRSSGSRCRRRSPGSTAAFSTRATHGPTPRPMTPRRRLWSKCSCAISPSSRRTWTMRSRPQGRWCARPPPSSGPSHRRRGIAEVQRRLCRFDGASAGALDWLAARPWAASAILLILTLACFLPGVVAVPPVDRTEVVYASTSRAMLERGDLLDAQLEGERFAYRPIGAFWLQAAAASLLGADARDDITTYRLPSLAGAILAVLATYWLLVPLLGGRGALIAAGLFGITVPVAVQAQLAIEGPVLPAAVIAQLALLRLYAAKQEEPTRGLALLFWAAQGFGVLINALAVPILSLSTLVALFAFDRNFAWLRRLRPLTGFPVMLLLGAPWLLVRARRRRAVRRTVLERGSSPRSAGRRR